MKALVDNEIRKKLNCIKLDNGDKYSIKEFDSYFSYHGICREKKNLGSPQENGVSKMMNRTLMEHARSVRLHA